MQIDDHTVHILFAGIRVDGILVSGTPFDKATDLSGQNALRGREGVFFVGFGHSAFVHFLTGPSFLLSF